MPTTKSDGNVTSSIVNFLPAISSDVFSESIFAFALRTAPFLWSSSVPAESFLGTATTTLESLSPSEVALA